MTDLVIRSIIAGVLFGVWPLMMQRSGLQGNVSSLLFAGMAVVTVLPFAMRTGIAQSMSGAIVWLVVVAGICGGLGLLALNGMLARVSREQVGSMFVIMLMAQVAVPVVYQMVITGDYSARRLAGIAAAASAVLLLK